MTADPMLAPASRPFRLAVLDTGEPVARLVAAAAELDTVTTVVVHAGGPAPWFARDADETLLVESVQGPSVAISALVEALTQADVDGVWSGALVPGPALPVFVEACEQAGLVVAGPSSQALRRLADLDALAARSDLGRAPAGGRSRLVEVDLIASESGVLTLPPRDVIVDRAGYLVIGECPAVGLSEEVMAASQDAASRVARAAGVRGGLTVTLRVADGSLSLVGVDVLARAEQAILDEAVTTHLMQLRLGLLLGLDLPEHLPELDGHMVGVTLLALDPDRRTPSAGDHRVLLMDLPAGVGVRGEASPRVGDDVSGIVTTLGAWGRDREQALVRLRRALERTTVVLHDAVTNRSELIMLLAHPDLATGGLDEGWDARRAADQVPASDPLAVVAAAVEAYEADLASVRSEFLAGAARGRPQRPEEVGTRLTLDYRGADVGVVVERRGPSSYHVALTPAGGAAVEVDAVVEPVGPFERRLATGGRRYRVVASEQGAAIRLEIDGLAHTVVREDGMAVRTPRPALVSDLHVQVGDVVRAGQPLATLESMKMLSTVTSPYDGVVTAVAVLPNTQIERGATLLRVRSDMTSTGNESTGGGESTAGNAPHAPAEALDLGSLTASTRASGEGLAAAYRRLRDYLLGYDLSPAALKRVLTDQRTIAAEADPADARLASAEDDLLDLYAEIAALYRPRTEGDALGEIEAADTQEYFLAFLQWLDADRAGVPDRYRERLTKAFARYGVEGLAPGPDLDAATLWMFRAFSRVPVLADAITTVLQRRMTHATEVLPVLGDDARERLNRLARSTAGRAPSVAALARDLAFTLFEEPALEALVTQARTPVLELLDQVGREGAPSPEVRTQAVQTLLDYQHPLRAQLLATWIESDPAQADLRDILLEASLRRYYRRHDLTGLTTGEYAGVRLAAADYETGGRRVHVISLYSALMAAYELGPAIRAHLEDAGLLTGPEAERTDVVVGVLSWRRSPIPHLDELADATRAGLEQIDVGRRLARVDLTVTSRAGVGKEHTRTQHVSFTQDDEGAWVEETLYRNFHPAMAERLDVWRLSNFDLERLASPEDVYLFLGTAKENPSDRRLFALVEVRDLTRVTEGGGRASYPGIERLGLEALAAMRSALSTFPPRKRPAANRLIMVVRPEWAVPADEWLGLARGYEPLARGVGLEKLAVHVRLPGEQEERAILVEGLGSRGLSARITEPRPEPIRPLTRYAQKVLTAERFGSPYPYEIIRMLTPAHEGIGSFPHGTFTEYDLDPDTSVPRLVPVDREPAQNSAHLVVGVLTTYTRVVPEGMRRVAILSDPTQGLGNLSEPECVRINAALDLAKAEKLPVEWYAVSSGALIALDSGTENMDWISNTLRRIIEFTQGGGEINIIVTGINVGGQPYWNAEATMLMHTKGILIMTPASQMVLTGKQALDFSGAVSAEDNSGIGGYDRIMGPNGQAQYWAPSFEEACRLLLRHYDYTYVVPGERFPRRRPTTDIVERDVRTSPHAEVSYTPFRVVGDVFGANPERKQPFDMRSVMRAVADVDDTPLERWQHWRDSDTSIVWDATIGGIPVCLLGLESHAVPRTGFVPSDGPPAWTSGTLFPQASRKTARAINATSGNRPLVVLANLSGFDGSPESMRNWQLEYGAEIGRAITNFDGPIVFVVVSRYHGGAFVVFSKQLNDHMQIAAVEGSYASVIGGAPAAATVFAREVKKRTAADPRVVEAGAALEGVSGAEAAAARARLADVTARVRSEKLGEMAEEFDGIHSVERALRVGSVDHIIAAADLRPWIIEALEQGMSAFTS